MNESEQESDAREKHLEKQRQYYQKNKERIKTLNNQRYHEYAHVNHKQSIKCECGKIVKRGSIYTHLKTNIHKNYMELNHPETKLETYVSKRAKYHKKYSPPPSSSSTHFEQEVDRP